VGVLDTDERVRGRGVEVLTSAGVAVQVVNDAGCEYSLRPYLHHRRTGRPYVIAKVAATLDGAVSAEDGTSQWITSAEARRDGHELRADSQAIIVGAGTVRADDPSLTARLDGVETQPQRIVLGSIPPNAKVLPARSYDGPLDTLLDELGSSGVIQVLLEGGPRVVGPALRDGLVDRVVWYAAPAFAGLETGRPALASLRTSTIDELRRGEISSVRLVGSDVRIEVEIPNAEHD
jgi:diaminohydroxyphosphoribosylaminopyrimidine deaminase/5-amino-6-(5-phosphoribosylamino)uracil reductase